MKKRQENLFCGQYKHMDKNGNRGLELFFKIPVKFLPNSYYTFICLRPVHVRATAKPGNEQRTFEKVSVLKT
jgi:hypothetical protein